MMNRDFRALAERRIETLRRLEESPGHAAFMARHAPKGHRLESVATAIAAPKTNQMAAERADVTLVHKEKGQDLADGH